MMIDDAERVPEADIFHAWNRAQAEHRPLLIVADAAPPDWTVRLADLRSRLAATPVLTLGPPTMRSCGCCSRASSIDGCSSRAPICSTGWRATSNAAMWGWCESPMRWRMRPTASEARACLCGRHASHWPPQAF
ncbi:MAG: hypothetical protein WDN24_14120 [Sphingomonas sp.]